MPSWKVWCVFLRTWLSCHSENFVVSLWDFAAVSLWKLCCVFVKELCCIFHEAWLRLPENFVISFWKLGNVFRRMLLFIPAKFAVFSRELYFEIPSILSFTAHFSLGEKDGIKGSRLLYPYLEMAMSAFCSAILEARWEADTADSIRSRNLADRMRKRCFFLLEVMRMLFLYLPSSLLPS